MRYVFKSLKLLFTKHIFICVLILLCQTASAFGLAFSVGMIEHYQRNKDESIAQALQMDFYIMDKIGTNSYLPTGQFGQLKELLSTITPQEYEKIIHIWCNVGYPQYGVFDGFGPTKYHLDINYDPELERINYSHWFWDQNRSERVWSIVRIHSGRIWTEQEYFEGKYVIASAHLANVGDVVDVFGESHMVIGTCEGRTSDIYVSLYSLSDDTPLYGLTFRFESLPTRAEFESLRNKVSAAFGALNYEDASFEPLDQDSIRFMNTVIFAAIAAALLTAVNLAILFRYLLGERRKALAILRLHGCTSGRARQLYIAEIMAVSVPLYALCVTVYHTLLLPKLELIYPYIGTAYTLRSTLLMAAVYLGSVFLILNTMVAVHVRKTPVRLLREGVR